jgi:Tfp pilus assembly protein PilF
MAQSQINTKQYESAIESLNDAIENGPNKQMRIRWTFIKAQLYERVGNNFDASKAYKEVVRLKPSNYDMLFTAQLNRAKNFDVYMESSNIVYRELNKMLEDEKNIEYRDQIYYVMAEVALAEEEYDKSEQYLKKSIRASVKNNVQKGLSYLKIADIDFSFKEYVKAQAYYDSASSTLPAAHKKFAFAKKRKESLTGLVNNINIITLEDSLQKVALMSPEAQRKMYEQYIVWLKEDEQRKAREKELKELNEQLVAESKNMNNGQTVGGQTGWYFYNTNSRSSGISAFQSKWGTRKLEDNWRQKNKTSVSFNDTETAQNTDADPNNTSSKGGKYDPDFYLVKVPNTPEMLDSSNARIMKAYVELGNIYKEELNDVKESSSAYSKVLTRYPGCKYEPRVLFSLYRLYIGEEKTEKAEEYKTQLVSKYPNNVYTKILLNPGKQDKNDESYKVLSALYKSIYEDYKKGNYKGALKTLEAKKPEYENSLLEGKFALLEAMCYGKQKKEKEFIEGLQYVVAKFPNTQEAIAAQSTLDLTDQGGGGTTPEPGASMGNYVYDGNVEHKFIAIVPNNGVDMNAIRVAFSNFNQQYFKLDGLQIQNIFFDADRQLIIISGFKNAAKAKVYYNGLSANQTIMGYLPAQVTTKIIISNDNYKALYKDKNLKEYLNFQKEKYQIEESI